MYRNIGKLSIVVSALLWCSAAGAQGRDQEIVRMEQEVKKLNTRIDGELKRLFRDQVKAAVYRMRLKDLQAQWHQLFAQVGLKRKKVTLPPLDPNEFRIEEAAGSDAPNLERALLSPSCKRRRGCRIYTRIGFGKNLLKKKGLKARVWAEVKNKSGTKSLAVPAQMVPVTKGAQQVILDLSKLSLYKDSFEGNLQVVLDGRYKAKAFKFQLLNTY